MVQHLSIRVTWHDKGWDGTICQSPEQNHICSIFNDATQTEQAKELALAGKYFNNKNYCACVLENSSFMSSRSITVPARQHPNKNTSGFRHILDTSLEVPKYSFVALPYAWLTRENAQKAMGEKQYCTTYNKELEPHTFSNKWVSSGVNQEKILNYFYKNVHAKHSLVVAHTQALPFIESNANVILGIGHITSLEEIQEYAYTGKVKASEQRAFMWERCLGHSIRLENKQGFLFPIASIQEYFRMNPSHDVNDLLVFAPNQYSSQFQYQSEHLSYDALIYILKESIRVLRRFQELGIGDGNWDSSIKYCQEKLLATYKQRGAYSGLATILSYIGVPFAFDFVQGIKFDSLKDVTKHIKNYNRQLDASFKEEQKSKCIALFNMNKTLFELLARFAITKEHLSFFFGEATIENIDSLTSYTFERDIQAILNNPYILYEITRKLPKQYQISFEMIDNALLVEPSLIKAFSFPKSYAVHNALDERRIRALVINLLEQTATNGNSLALQASLVHKINSYNELLQNNEELTVEMLTNFEEFFSSEITAIKYNESSAYQLKRLQEFHKVIRSVVNAKLSVNYNLNVYLDWNIQFHRVLGEFKDDIDAYSRQEKITAIEGMISKGIFVLTGGAGTGKTTAITVMCKAKEIQDDSILVLAPTGKAKMVLSQKLNEQNINHDAYTVFQFLLRTNHCDYDTMSFYLSDKESTKSYGTVIVDESSMLTEEMMAALLNELQNAKRVIFLGDPNQLPPIGLGKPFCDLVDYVKEHHPSNYYNLTISNRQKSFGAVRHDLEFANLFSNEKTETASNYILPLDGNEHIEFVHFDDSNFSEQLQKTINKIIEVDKSNPHCAFDISLGATIEGNNLLYNSAQMVENWQIISPYRNIAKIGTHAINKLIQRKFHTNDMNESHSPSLPYTKHSLGSDRILYGDKVINTQNQVREAYPSNEVTNYISNGEIGIATTAYDTESRKWYHEIQFASQPTSHYRWISYKYDDCSLELAYALTVHKTQGSGFETTILVIHEESEEVNPFISKEMMYTALTRHSDKVYILYNKEPKNLLRYSDHANSSLRSRLTNLFT